MKIQKNKKINIFIDMDGVLAEQSHDLSKYMNDEHFFENLPPVMPMIELARKLHNNKQYNTFILSSLANSTYCEHEKNIWLNKYLPEIADENRLFVPQGQLKSNFVKSKLNIKNNINVLIDDFTFNLVNWNINNGIGIKVINTINNTKGTWVNQSKPIIFAYDNPLINVNYIENLLANKENLLTYIKCKKNETSELPLS